MGELWGAIHTEILVKPYWKTHITNKVLRWLQFLTICSQGPVESISPCLHLSWHVHVCMHVTSYQGGLHLLQRDTWPWSGPQPQSWARFQPEQTQLLVSLQLLPMKSSEMNQSSSFELAATPVESLQHHQGSNQEEVSHLKTESNLLLDSLRFSEIEN